MKKKSVAFIPARSGSKRIPNKNVKIIAGHPLLAYTIRSAIESNVFDAVICATDDEVYANVARHYGAEVPFLRPTEISSDQSPDVEWVVWMLRQLKNIDRNYDIFSILRPTSPFRLPTTIERAWHLFCGEPMADSLRAVEKCKQHPGKMWVLNGRRLLPLMPLDYKGTPWHSCQYSVLPQIYVQNASLEIAWSRVPLEQNTIAGNVVIPFISEGLEGFDINDPEDWLIAEKYLELGDALLPSMNTNNYQFNIK
jgi:CMP-N,N'-diacetyllegionaminic acid synthase